MLGFHALYSKSTLTFFCFPIMLFYLQDDCLINDVHNFYANLHVSVYTPLFMQFVINLFILELQTLSVHFCSRLLCHTFNKLVSISVRSTQDHIFTSGDMTCYEKLSNDPKNPPFGGYINTK